MNMLLLSISCSCDEIRRGISVTVIQRAQSDVSACFIHYISQLELPDEAKVRDAARRRAGDAQESPRRVESERADDGGWLTAESSASRRVAFSPALLNPDKPKQRPRHPQSTARLRSRDSSVSRGRCALSAAGATL